MVGCGEVVGFSDVGGMGRGACAVVGGIGTADVGTVANGATRSGTVDRTGRNGGGAATGMSRCDGASGTVNTFDGRCGGGITG